MSLLSPLRRSALRPQLLIHRRAVAAQAHVFTFCRLRQNSTFCPTNIAALLRPASPLSSTPQGASESETLTVHGYVRSVRKQKRIAFAAIGDGSTLSTVQAVLPPQLAEESV